MVEILRATTPNVPVSPRWAVEGRPSCFFHLHQLFVCTDQLWSCKCTELLLLVFISEDDRQVWVSSLLFSTNTRCRAACFYLQKILVLNYISSRSKCLEKVQITWKKWSKYKEKNSPDQGSIQKLLICCCSLFWDYKLGDTRKKKREREIFRIFFAQESLQSFLFYFYFGRMNYLDLILPVNHCGH